jgi:hypothetical protein
MADDKLIIQIELDDGTVRQGFINIKNEASDAARKIENDFNKSNGSIGNIAKGVFLGELAFKAFSKVITETFRLLETGFKEGIKSSSDYQTAVNALNISLAQAGQFSKEASNSFREYADSLEETTKFSEEQILTSASLIETLSGLTATSAALDLSSAFNIDLNTASTLLGKSTSGNISGLQKLGFQIQKGSSDAQTYANVLAELARLQGTSSLAANTYDGSLIRLKNSFTKLLKELGDLVTRSPAVVALFNSISKTFKSFSSEISSGIGGRDIFKNMIIDLSVVAQAGIETARKIGLSFELAFLRATAAVQAFTVVSTAGLSDSFNAQLAETNKAIDETIAKFSEETGLIKFFDDLILKISETNGKLKEFTDGVKNIPIETQPAIDASRIASDSFIQGFTGSYKLAEEGTKAFAEQQTAAADRVAGDFSKMGESAKNTLGNAVGGGFAAFGKSLAKGENALSAFAKAFIGAIGQGAIATGTEMILRGIGYSFDPLLSGFAPGLIAAGSALAAFGGVLSAAGGGGGGGGSAPSPGGGGTSSGLSSPELGTEPQKPQNQISVTIMGDVLDSNDTGTRIVDLLRQYGDKNGAAVLT